MSECFYWSHACVLPEYDFEKKYWQAGEEKHDEVGDLKEAN
jgi:hypothetical protein